MTPNVNSRDTPAMVGSARESSSLNSHISLHRHIATGGPQKGATASAAAGAQLEPEGRRVGGAGVARTRPDALQQSPEFSESSWRGT